tara:strand:+ start:63 stop:338 length:276 start_codon:yes stop_codon:yes gene_type:complete
MKTIINGVVCKTQQQAVIEYLKTGKQIDQEQAYEICGSQRLGAIICNLRKKGYRIFNVKCEGRNRFGNYTRFSKYALANTLREIENIENES